MARRSRLYDRGTLTEGIRERARVMEEEAADVTFQAAQQATHTSRKVFTSRLGNRPTVAPRPGRPTTQGAFANHIHWEQADDGYQVEAQIDALAAVAPYWLIQEIGTGAQALMGGIRGGQGRSGQRVPANVRVPSQVGRRIPSGLIWSGTSGSDQIVRSNRPWEQPITIRKEIQGKHYLRRGGTAGYAYLRKGLEKAFRGAFGDHPKR